MLNPSRRGVRKVMFPHWTNAAPAASPNRGEVPQCSHAVLDLKAYIRFRDGGLCVPAPPAVLFGKIGLCGEYPQLLHQHEHVVLYGCDLFSSELLPGEGGKILCQCIASWKARPHRLFLEIGADRFWPAQPSNRRKRRRSRGLCIIRSA